MAYSTLTHPNGRASLWCSNQSNYIYHGTEEQCDQLKDSLEREEQREENAACKKKIYDERVRLLVSSGRYTDQQARALVDTMFRRFAEAQ